MHCVHNVGKCHSLVRKKLLEFMGGITVNPVTCWSTGNGLADLGEIFWRQAKFIGISGYFAMLSAVLLDGHQELQKMTGNDIFYFSLFDFTRINIPHIV